MRSAIQRRQLSKLALAVAFAAAAAPVFGQYVGHTQNDDKKPPPPRATAVLEWVGTPGKPKASRIVPVTIFVNGQYQDAGLYLARPAPLAVMADISYELEKAGAPQGVYNLNDGQNIDGAWYGFGDWKPLATPPKPKELPPSRIMPQAVRDNDSDKPYFKGKSPAAEPADSRPAASQAPASPAASDSPTLHKRDDSQNASSGNGSSADDDPDKPTLHRHTSTPSDVAASGAGMAPEDPDRPRFTHNSQEGTPTYLSASKLIGMPPDLQQMAAVSDASQREEHSFAYAWPSPDSQTAMKTAMEGLAIKAVLPPSPVPEQKKPASPASHPGAPRSTLAHMVAPKPPPVTFSDEDFRAYELSYGGGATVVFTATAHVGPNNAGVTTDKYVTIIAQPDFNGDPQLRFQSVTSQSDLDITPRMRLVDAVDTNGDNRAELVFELRRSSDRQFAIYRMKGAKAEQAFTTEPLSYAGPTGVQASAN